MRERTEADEHVAALLHRHEASLVLCRLAARVALLDGERIASHVVRRERPRPARMRGVDQDRRERGAGERRRHHQQMWELRIEHVNGADAAVGVVLLREVERLAVTVRHELACGERLPICERGESGVLLPAEPHQVACELRVERVQPGEDRSPIRHGLPEHRLEREAVAPPPCGQRVAEELYGLHVVVRQQEMRFAILRRGRPHQPGVAPVAAHAVAALAQRRLLLAADRHRRQACDGRDVRDHRRLVVVSRERRRDGGTKLPAGRAGHARGHVGDGPREDLEVLRQLRRREPQFHCDAVLRERAYRLRGTHLHALLRHRRHGLRCNSAQAPCLAVRL